MDFRRKNEYVNLGNTQTKFMKEHLKDPKYKTEMCKNFMKTGVCSYKNKCRYAHGESELISKNLSNKNYKRIECDKFNNSPGICPYGYRCQYIHHARKLEDIEFVKFNFYSMLIKVKSFGDYLNSDHEIDKNDSGSSSSTEASGDLSNKFSKFNNLKKAVAKVDSETKNNAKEPHTQKPSYKYKRLQVFSDLKETKHTNYPNYMKPIFYQMTGNKISYENYKSHAYTNKYNLTNNMNVASKACFKSSLESSSSAYSQTHNDPSNYSKLVKFTSIPQQNIISEGNSNDFLSYQQTPQLFFSKLSDKKNSDWRKSDKSYTKQDSLHTNSETQSTKHNYSNLSFSSNYNEYEEDLFKEVKTKLSFN